MRFLVPALLAAACFSADGGLDVIRPGDRYATFDFGAMRVHVPAAQAEALRPLAGRAAAIYRRLCQDAHYDPSQRTLHLVLTDDRDDPNGFSTVVPFPLVNVRLVPARPESSIFFGDEQFSTVLVHELTHHIANDRTHGFRGALDSFFGRVLPSDPLSLLVFLASTPQHITQPSFWQEGTAQWAETAYADPAAAWSGRGRDSLTHLVWRLDAAAGRIPEPGDWRLSYTRWPYGSETYIYGLAYTRWLAARHPDIWRVLDDQGRSGWPSVFDAAGTWSVGERHGPLLEQARADLLAEQRQQIATLSTEPLTRARRLTPEDWRWSAPAWMGDRLLAAGDPPQGVPTLQLVAADGSRQSGPSAWALGGLRSAGDGWAVYAETEATSDPWTRSRIALVDPDLHRTWLSGERLFQPDARRVGNGWEVVAVQVLPAGRQELVRLVDGHWLPIPSQGQAWSPTWRPGAAELAWVETGHEGSRLVLAGADGGQRRVLWQVRGRILHPVWSSDGQRLFVCADHTGVANAWAVEIADGSARPVTNTLGGILACVPSPDGRELAIVDIDQRGPFLARIPADPATWPRRAPEIHLVWPAPGGGEARLAPIPAAGPAPAAQPYSGLGELRPRFWTPTLYAVPEGGLGVVGVATDALLTHEVVASIGVGNWRQEAVGLLGWTYSGWPLEVAGIAWRSELNYDQQVYASDGQFHDYTETVKTGEVRVGRGISGMRTRWQAYLAAGLADRKPVEAAVNEYAGFTTAGPAPSTGMERYVEATVAYSDALLFPTSYAPEDGPTAALSYRTSGFGGDYLGNRALGLGSWSLPVWPAQGHQVVLAGQLGWSDGPQDLQGRFGVGGDPALGIPRGYPKTMARGRDLLAWSTAYRLPLWRPFSGVGTTPLAWRQVVLEGFCEGAQVADEWPTRHEPWFRSAGGELHMDFEFSLLRLQPGLGTAWQLDGDKDRVSYLALGFRW